MERRTEPSRPVPPALDAVDRRIAAFMRRWGILALRVSLAAIFIWFGILKPLGLSPAGPMVRATVGWMPLLSPDTWVAVIGWWEVAIGLTFLFHRTVRIAIALLALQMAGTFLPLVLLPHVTFQPGHIPYAPTIE
ncbi:MAG TPA: DoxX family protein, partial [Longimicrobiales bacterium]|nr:DoxX family protein [Longimicrobiales bacterium]